MTDNDPSTTDPTKASRRAFLKTAAVGVGGFAAGAAVAGGTAAVIASQQSIPGFDPLAPRSEPGFDHVVTLMFENRSFDNILGWLYSNDELPSGATFDGLAQGSYSNPGPAGDSIEAHVYEGSTDEVMRHPQPDPGETYPHVNTQIFNVVDPATNADLYANGLQSPFNAPSSTSKPEMSGFVTDYVINYKELKKGTAPTAEEYRVAMGSFSPDMLPVFSAIAKGFAVYDAWHAGVPSQTFCNRSFFHASTSHGFVTNKDGGGYSKWIDAPPAPTIFNRLEEAGLSWRVYYDISQMVSFTGMLHAAVLEPYWKTNFRSMDQFYEDVKNGALPAYSFVEPRMVFNHNDMHPPFGTLKENEYEGQEFYDSALSDVRAGETLLHDVYSALRSAKSETGSNAINTAFLVTFDEHGGTFDHVPPPSAVPPTPEAPAGEMGFTFDRLGCRVPALLVSAYTAPGTIIHDEMHHGSLIATLNRLHGLSPLTRRDATANNVFNAVNLQTPRQTWEWPVTHPAYTPKNPEDVPKPNEKHKHRPLSAPAKGLLGLLLAKYEPDLPVPETYGDAYDVLVKHGKGLFGDRD
ncbi:alkaline phosphatase family protein [Salinibacterium soli]|uniref:phospholipase C n=1 Tax=Antiquaquibacter soli TaxID=3064523 RepID=A0ABT9BMY6_9MICO|nr:alkaline phosphatase family protein [Protaetiibacter sp. WY-16]MDO7882396.1 alkaline phosphatase family protein [Protaetiibacter sp. WY-16]